MSQQLHGIKKGIRIDNTTSINDILSYAGSPESVLSANPGSICMDYTYGEVYYKDSGTGNTGWIKLGDNITLKANGGLVYETGELAVDLGASAITGTLAVGDGGTGATTLTDHGVLIGSGTGAVTPLSVGTNDQVLLGSTGADPSFTTLTGDVTISGGATVIGTDVVDDTMIDWGTGANQVSGVDVPIADVGTLFTTDNVEAALAEVMGDLNAVEDNGISAGTGLSTSGTIGADTLSVAVNTATGSATFTGGTWTFPVDVLQVTGTPNSANDATNKSYVDAVASGLSIKSPVRMSSTVALASETFGATGVTYANGTAGVGATLTQDDPTDGAFSGVDGVGSIQVGDTILIKNQGTATQNGIYEVTTIGNGTDVAWVLTRITPYDEPAEITDGSFFFVQEGTTYADCGFVQTNVITTIGTDAIAFAQFSSAGVITAGAGLSQTGNTFNVGDANKGVQVNTNDLEISASELAHASGGLVADGTNTWQLKIKPDATTGATIAPITIGANGAGITLDNDTIVHTAGTLKVATDSIGLLEIDMSAIYGNGLTSAGADSVLTVDPDNGISVSASGVAVNLTSNGGLALSGTEGSKTLGVSVDATTNSTELNSNGEVSVIGFAHTSITDSSADFTTVGGLVVDTISLNATGVNSVKWMVEINDGSVSNSYACEIYALTDATNVDWTEFSLLKLGTAIAGLTLTPTISGTDLVLKVAADSEATGNYKVTRIVNSKVD